MIAFPFTIKRSDDVYGAKEISSTKETVHGLLRFDGARLIIQWRTSRAIERYGKEIRTDREVEPVREVSMPVSAIAGAQVRWSWLRWPPGHYLELTGADLVAFEGLAGKEGLVLKHPAQLAIKVPRAAIFAAQEFAGELNLALADRALRAAEDWQLPESQ